MPAMTSTAARNCATRSSSMRFSLSEAVRAMIAQTASPYRATMLASLVRIFHRLSRFISTSVDELFAEELSGTFLPIVNDESVSRVARTETFVRRIIGRRLRQFVSAEAGRNLTPQRGHHQERDHAREHANQRKRDQRIKV